VSEQISEVFSTMWVITNALLLTVNLPRDILVSRSCRHAARRMFALQHPFVQSSLYALPGRPGPVLRPCLIERQTAGQMQDEGVLGT